MVKFVKKYVDEDDIETLSISQLFKQDIPKGWGHVFQECEEELESISDIIDEDENENGKCFPLRANIFRIFHMLRPEQVKVLIIGQDPYHNRTSSGEPAATGIAFSTWREEKKQPSVHNMYLELKNCYPEFEIPNHGDLTNWVKQGVMLLNTSLTVAPNKPNSHSEIWMGFISKVIKHLVKSNGKKMIVFLWGNNAKRLVGQMVSSCTVFEAAHPSPFSVNRGFFGCQHYKLCNDVLEKNKIEKINWLKL